MAEIENTASTREQVDLVRRVLLRKWWLIVLLGLLSGAAAFGTAKLLSPVYETSTTVRILKEQGLAEAPPKQFNNRGQGTLQAEQSWFTSRQVLEAVVKRLALAESMPPSLLERGVAKGQRAINKLLGRPEREDARLYAVLDNLRNECVKVKELEGSNVLEIRVNWSDPEMTMRIANTLVDVFIEQFKEFNRGRAHENRTYLEQQVQLVANQLKESEKTLVDFQKSTGLMTVGDKTGGASTHDELDRLATEKRQLELEYASATAQLAELDSRVGDSGSGKSTNNRALRAGLANPNSLLRMLMTQAAMNETDSAKSAQTVKVESPLSSRASRELEGIKKRISQELTQLKADPALGLNDLLLMIPDDNGKGDRTGLAARVKVMKEQLDNLEKEMGQAQKETQTLPDELQRFMTLAREKRVNEDLYTSLCQRLAGAQVDENSDLCDVRVFDPAQLPVAPTKPKPALLAGMGTFMGLLLGICFAFCLEYLNDSLRTSEEVQAYLGLPVLAEVPKVRVRRSLLHGEAPRVRWRQIS